MSTCSKQSANVHGSSLRRYFAMELVRMMLRQQSRPTRSMLRQQQMVVQILAKQ